MKNSSNILLGILGAAAAGVVIGMIIAPQKGSDLRADLQGSADDFTRKLGKMLSKGKDKYNELRSMIDEEGATVKTTAEDIADQASSAYRDYSNRAEEAYDEFSKGAGKAYKKAKA